jgi:hypothetical protein
MFFIAVWRFVNHDYTNRQSCISASSHDGRRTPREISRTKEVGLGRPTCSRESGSAKIERADRYGPPLLIVFSEAVLGSVTV